MSVYPRYLSRWPQPLSAEALDALPPDRLHEYYHDRQLRYMGVIAPPYTARFTLSRRTPPHLVRLEDNVTITVDQAAFAMEMMLSPTSLQPKATDGHGERTRWFGAEVLQNPVDSSTLAMHLATHQPDLLLEVGTNCGGSALFFLSLMKQYNKRAKLITWDVVETYKRACGNTEPRFKGYNQPAFKRFVKEGSLITRVADVAEPAELALAREHARQATTVMVIDDGDHTTTPLLVHFHHLSRLVTNGSYYLIQDTRLDRNCRAQKRVIRTGVWGYCHGIMGRKGGPARAVHVLQNESDLFRRLGFRVDRSPERYVFTQHPGGWLRRLVPN